MRFPLFKSSYQPRQHKWIQVRLLKFSVAGANLRRKRRRLQVDDAASQSAAILDRQYLEESFGDEIRKKEYFQYFSLPWPTSPSSEKLSLEQGGFVMDRRLQDLSLTVSLIIHIYKMTKQ